MSAFTFFDTNLKRSYYFYFLYNRLSLILFNYEFHKLSKIFKSFFYHEESFDHENNFFEFNYLKLENI